MWFIFLFLFCLTKVRVSSDQFMHQPETKSLPRRTPQIGMVHSGEFLLNAESKVWTQEIKVRSKPSSAPYTNLLGYVVY